MGLNPEEKRFLKDYKKSVEEGARRKIQAGEHKEAARKTDQIVKSVLKEIENFTDGEAYALISVLLDNICMNKMLDKERVITCLVIERGMLNVEDEEEEGGTEQ